MERAMAASSHTLVRGPITRRDWFSLRLGAGGREGGRKRGEGERKGAHLVRSMRSIKRGREGWNLLRGLSISMVMSTERAMVIG